MNILKKTRVILKILNKNNENNSSTNINLINTYKIDLNEFRKELQENNYSKSLK